MLPMLPLPAAMGGAVVLAADAATAADPVALLVNGGPSAIVVALFILGKLTTGRELDRVVAERDRAESELRELRERLDDKILPVLIRNQDVLARLAEQRIEGA